MTAERTRGKMLVSLIPLLFAANISINEIDWKYGPEVIYDVKIDAISNSLELPESGSIFNTTTKLTCRPKSVAVLSCRFYNPLIILQHFKDRNKLRKMPSSKDFNYDIPFSGPFELYFSDDGLEKIVVSSSIHPTSLDTMRALVDQLNFCSRISENFQRVENSSTGECTTHYVMSRKEVPKDDASIEESDDDIKHPYEILIMPGNFQTSRGYVNELQRTRYLNTCRHQYGYIFSTWQGPGGNFIARPYDSLASKPIETKFESSISGLSFTGSSFSSYTEKVLTVNDNTNPTTATLTERVTLTLDKIIPAKQPLSYIEDPVIVSIFPERWILNRNSLYGSKVFRKPARRTVAGTRTF